MPESGSLRAALGRLLSPKSVAVLGASPTARWGRQMVENFRTLPFAGQVAAVNPKYPDIAGFPCYPSLKELPFKPDAVVVGVGWERVLPVIEECAAIGAGGAVIFAIGFAEAGPEGRALQARLQAIAREAGMAVIGPNCQGYISFRRPCALYMGAVQAYEPGSVALISQSGSVTTAMVNNVRGVRFSHVVSCGNEAVNGCEDLLAYFLDDPQTSQVLCFLETIRKPEQFFAECVRAFELGKPVVVVKSGRTEAARNAAMAHSGALALPDRLIDELFRRHRVLRVDSLEELLETSIVLAGPRPSGPGLACTTGSGGQIELLLDAAECTGATFPAFQPETQSRLREILPSFLATSNPLDVWGTTNLEENYPRILEIIASDPGIHAIMPVIEANHYPTGNTDERGSCSYPPPDPLRAVTALRPKADKLLGLLGCVDGSVEAQMVEDLAEKGIVVLSGMQEGLRAIERAAAYAQAIAPPASRPELPVDLAGRLQSFGARTTAGLPALNLLDAIGIPTVASRLVHDSDEAAAAAAELGFPVVLKTGDPEALHKTEGGGVVLGLNSTGAVREAAGRFSGPMLVQRQLTGGLEMILGLQTDPGLGTFVLCGLGGIWAEAFDDVAIRPVGLRQGEAGQMLDELRARKLLAGFRGSPPLKIDALTDAIERVSAAGELLGNQLTTLDINPLIVLPDGVVAVDALVVAS